MQPESSRTPLPNHDDQQQGFYQPTQPVQFEPPQTPPAAPQVAPAPQPQPQVQPPSPPPPTQPIVDDTDQLPPQDEPATLPNDTVTWEASEYIHHSKDALWFTGFIVIVAIFIALAWWLNAWTFVALIVIMAVAMAVFALRPPRTLHYALTSSGITIGEKFYSLNDFKAFGLIQEGAFFTITFVPVKRFMPGITIYFSEQEGEHIIDILGANLPMEQMQPDLLDSLMRRLRF